MEILDLIENAKTGDSVSYVALGKIIMSNEDELKSDTIAAAILYFKKAIELGNINGLIELMKMYEFSYFVDFKYILNFVQKFAANNIENKLKLVKYMTNRQSKFYSKTITQFLVLSVLDEDLSSDQKLFIAEILASFPFKRPFMASKEILELNFEISDKLKFKCLQAFSMGIINGERCAKAVNKEKAAQILQELQKTQDVNLKLKLIKILSVGHDFDGKHYGLADLEKAKSLFAELAQTDAFSKYELAKIYGSGFTIEKKDLKAIRDEKKAIEILWDIFETAKGDERYIIAQIFGSGKNADGVNFGIKSDDDCFNALAKIAETGAGYDKLEVAKIYGTGYDNDRDFYGVRDKEKCEDLLKKIQPINDFFNKEVAKILKTGKDSLNNNYGLFVDVAYDSADMHILTSLVKDLK